MTRCPYGFPAVVEDLPYGHDGRPFPTLYYCTCPTLVEGVSALESAGGVAAWEATVAGDERLAGSLATATAATRRRRRDLARRTVRRQLDGGASLTGGIGGVRDVRRLKCLHAHVATALACPGYALGEAIFAGVSRPWCDDCRCAAFAAGGPVTPMRVAIVDLGTNTCRLYLAEVGDEGALEPAARLTTVVRLGQGVDRSGRLHPEAVARTRACLREYAPRLEAYGPARRFLVATSVLRDAADGPAFLAAVERDFALPWRVLGGEEEGALAFRGGAAGLAAVAGPLALVDIGGGSTEFAVGVAGRRPDFVRSLDIGVVRLTERFLHHDPPLAGEVADLAGHVAATISEAVPDDVRAPVRAMVGVAGTYTTLVAHKLGLRRYDPALVHGHVLSRADIEAAVALLVALTNAERVERPGIQPGREDVILAGALIAREACRAFGLRTVRCSEADILEGAALALAEGSLAPA